MQTHITLKGMTLLQLVWTNMRYTYTQMMYIIAAANAESSGGTPLTNADRHDKKNDSSTIGMD